MIRALVCLSALTSAIAFADEPKVSVQAEIIEAKIDGALLEPPSLVTMQQALAKKVRYGTLKRLSTEKLELVKKEHTLALPNGKTASLALEQLNNDVAILRLKVPPSDTTYKLGRTGALYLQAGPHNGGDLWLVLSQPK